MAYHAGRLVATLKSAATRADTRAMRTIRRLPGGRITTTAWWKAYLALAGGRCAYCHASEETLTVEHIEPLSRGGTNTADNLLPVCADCNQAKADLTLAEFVDEWAFAAADGVAHPLGRIDAGSWEWSPAARRIQARRSQAERESARTSVREVLLAPLRFSSAFGEIAYAAAYDA